MKSIAQIVVGLPVEGPFDYKIPEEAQADLAVGQRVVVPFGRRDVMGYVVGFADKSTFSSLKEIKRVLDTEPIISAELLQLAQWIGKYYGCSYGEAIETVIPFSVRNRKKLKLSSGMLKMPPLKKKTGAALFLSHDDQRSFQEVMKRSQECFLQGQGVLFLAPDHVASQKVFDHASRKLKEKISRLDLGVSKQQVEDWVALKNGEMLCAVGLRSAVFAPVKNLGLVVVFEEHHYGYKEDQSPYYHAREVIMERARIEGFEVVFVSSAPTVELWSKVTSSECKTTLFQDDMAQVKLIDLANYKPRKESALSFPVVTAVSQVLDGGGKVLVLFNRRGFSTVIKCSACGHVLRCQRCEVSLTYIDEKKKMTCSSCDAEIDPINKCPECKATGFDRYGDGIERVESDLARFFPQAKLATFDRDTKSMSKSANIIVATQAIFRILDQMKIDIAVILDVDAELSRHDFRAHQKVFSLLMDLCKGVDDKVFVQTRQPLHSALSCARFMDLEGFYAEELQARKDLGFPPYQHLFEIMSRGKSESLTIEQADIIYEAFLEHPLEGFDVMPPQPGFQAKLRDQYRYIIMGKGLKEFETVMHIKNVLKEAKKKRGVIVTVNVDP